MNTLAVRNTIESAMHVLLCSALMVFSATSRAEPPPSSAAWNELLQAHVHVINDGHASQVDYAGMRHDQAKLDAYTHLLSAVTIGQFDGWNREQQMAFLINGYNAFTVQLVLTRWPKLDSIKDLGSVFSSAWKKDFFTLLGEKSDLDQIETRLRGKQYADPRVHVALNCASIGCPMLRPEVWVADQLDSQLEDAMNRFLGDHTRNRYDAGSDTVQVSKIFDWYADDFRQAPYQSVAGLLAAHAAQLSDDPKVQTRIQARKVTIDYLSYDWHLNGLPAS